MRTIVNERMILCFQRDKKILMVILGANFSGKKNLWEFCNLTARPRSAKG